MDQRTQGALQIVAAIAIAASVLFLSKDIAALSAYGYAGAFVISLLSSATILLPAPGWAAVAAMSKVLDPLLLGVCAGIGSAIGELSGYAAGDGTRDILNEKVRESRKIHELVERYGPAAIFVLAFIPNPLFDIAGIAAGGARISWWKFLLACACGRVLRYIVLASIGQWSLNAIA
ncbi:MAG: VTT domain-containing protein [Candidatus Micrarchaeia archaeon]